MLDENGKKQIRQAFRDAFLTTLNLTGKEVEVGEKKYLAKRKDLSSKKWLFQFAENLGMKKGAVITDIETDQQFSVIEAHEVRKGHTLTRYDVTGVMI